MLADNDLLPSDMPFHDCLLVQVTCPHSDAERLAKALLDANVAACVNILPEVQSIYRWKGSISRDSESLLLIKTTTDAYPALEQIVVDLHPYEVPEVIAFNIANGLASYFSWLHSSVR